MSDMRWIYRDGSDLVCHCKCPNAVMGEHPQLDCPWCGCGWLFTCASCGKAFTFGKVGMISEKDVQAIARKSPGAKANMKGWIEFHAGFAEQFEPGTRVVILDGAVIPVDHEGPLEFDGLHAHHELPWVPQVRALTDRTAIDTIMDPDYWEQNRLADDDDEGDDDDKP